MPVILRTSSGEVRQRFAQIFTWVDGMIVRLKDYRDAEDGPPVAERPAESRR